VLQRGRIDLEPAARRKRPLLPGEVAASDRIRRTHRRNDVNEVIGSFEPLALGRHEGRPARTDVDRSEPMIEVHADTQRLPSPENIVVDGLHTEHVAECRFETDP